MPRETVILQGTILIVFYTSYNEAHGLYIWMCDTKYDNKTYMSDTTDVHR